MIVIEGPDGAGKSTLIHRLLGQLPLRVLHGGGPPSSVAELRDRVWSSHQRYPVLDRWAAISELVYGRVLRGETAIPEQELYAAIERFNPTIIYCRPPMDVLLSRLGNTHRPEKVYKSEEHCQEVISRYTKIVEAYDLLTQQLQELSIATVVHYDHTKEL